MTIVIIPATSRTNSFVTKTLLSFPRPPSIRLVAHTNERRMDLQQEFMNRPNVSTAIADLLDLPSLRNALKGARAVFYNGPVHANEFQMGKNIVDAACAMDIEKLVYCSVLHPYISRLPHHRSKLEVEEYIFESGLNYTILQPSHLMQNISVYHALEHCHLEVPFSPFVTHGFLDLEDLAAAAVAILRARPSAHARTRYELVGDLASYRDVADRLSEIAGMRIRPQPVDCITAVQRQVDSGRLRDAYSRDALERMISYYDEQYAIIGIELCTYSHEIFFFRFPVA
ncbi:NAD-P-binding protein [Russula earlei]|uniref:NAD-P-binding protein n=1 Tax=Russula earlei TaxID=71964 RepID=A0ACC0U5W2_9AGAM|nr:NAD-P-binding protein [Russula earlei]